MKYLILAILAFGLWFLWPKNIQKQEVVIPVVPTPVESADLGDSAYYKLNQAEMIELIPNFTQKKIGTSVMEEFGCSFLTNGGFYTPEQKPLGLFWANGTQYGTQIQSATFNGFLAKFGTTISIASSPPEEFDWIVQTGPRLLQNGSPLSLRIQNDEKARRSVAGITSSGDIIFMSFIDLGQVHSGPYLADLSKVVAAFSQKEDLDLVSAVNLDGGSASTFVSPEITLSELTPVGSFLCVK